MKKFFGKIKGKISGSNPDLHSGGSSKGEEPIFISRKKTHKQMNGPSTNSHGMHGGKRRDPVGQGSGKVESVMGQVEASGHQGVRHRPTPHPIGPNPNRDNCSSNPGTGGAAGVPTHRCRGRGSL